MEVKLFSAFIEVNSFLTFMEGSLITSLIGVIIIVLAILFGLFYMFRQFLLWYWRVNEIVDLLKDIKNELSGNNSALEITNKKKTEIVCVHCGKDISIEKELIDSGQFVCPNCNKINDYSMEKEFTDDIIDAKCKYCDANLELNSDEFKNKKFICAECGKENIID